MSGSYWRGLLMGGAVALAHPDIINPWWEQALAWSVTVLAAYLTVLVFGRAWRWMFGGAL